MPTIPQLPAAESVSASDLVPISQKGAARAVSIGSLLEQMQPAINIPSFSLLGRVSIGPGGPEQIAIGRGLALSNSTLSATGMSGAGFDPASVPAQTQILPTDQILFINKGSTQKIEVQAFRGIYTAGPNITIDGSGTISASVPAAGTAYTVSTLTPVTSLAQGDLVAVSQSSKDHVITYANLLDGLTIDLAQTAGPASDSDTFWVAQTSNVMARQTLAALWPWLAGKFPLWKRRVVELGGNTALDGTVHNNAILVCTTSLSISALAANMGSGFSCDVINAGGGAVIFIGSIVTSNGAGTLSPNQCATIYCATYSGGTTIFAAISLGATAAVASPGQISGLSAGSVTSSGVTLSWAAPSTGGAVSLYTIQYRIAGTSAWQPYGQGIGNTTLVVTGLLPGTTYEFTVAAVNAAGPGSASGILTVATPPSVGVLPNAPTNLSLTTITSTAMTCSWTGAPAGGTGLFYTVQFRITGQGVWNTAANNLSALTVTITGLSPSTSYDVQVFASNNAGTGPASASVTATTIAGSGLVTSIAWNLAPIGTVTHGSGAMGVNAHVNPASAAVQFGFSTSPTLPPSTWVAGLHVNTDFWGAYVPTPSTAGTWYAWVEGTDGSAPTVYATPFTVT